MKKLSPIQERLDFILPHLDKKDKKTRIIDLGCGTGLLSKEIYYSKRIRVHGFDLDKKNIEICKNNGSKNKYYCKDVASINIKRIDVLICSEVLEHLKNPEELLKKINKITDKDSEILITIPNGYGPWELFENQPLEIIRDFIENKPKIKRFYLKVRDKLGLGAKDSVNSGEGSRHIQRFTYKKIKNIFEKSGFELIESENTHFFSCLLPFRLLRERIKFIYYTDRWICRHIPKSFSSGWGFYLKKKSQKINKGVDLKQSINKNLG